MTTTTLQFTDSSSVKDRPDRYMTVRVRTADVLTSWKKSLFSFEWLTPEGTIRALDDLPIHERDKRLRVEKTLKGGQAVERPVLGIGMLDNVEIGAGRDVFLTLAAQGVPVIEVHIPVSNARDFKPFLKA